jgi:hypothetical protein
MPQCPQCSKKLVDLSPRCPTCQADLGLLLDYVSHMQGGLERAENLTRAGELGQAVWTYLEVLEVDPDNATARRQVGQVATAVRQFDMTAPGRRWAQGLDPFPKKNGLFAWLKTAVLSLVLVLVFGIGYFMGSYEVDASDPSKDPPAPREKDNSLGGQKP